MDVKNEQVWNEIRDFFKVQALPFQLGKSFQHSSDEINLIIDVDPGGGFESGFEFTSLSADLPVQFTSFKTQIARDPFRFSIHRQNMIDRIAKFLGMEDVETGFKAFDEALIIKTNDPNRLKQIFNDESIRNCLLQHPQLSLQFTGELDEKNSTLEMNIDVAITDLEQLKDLYNCFSKILDAIKAIQP